MRTRTRIVALMLLCVMCVAIFCSCDNGSGGGGLLGGTTNLSFWVYGDKEELALYTAMTKEFNNTYGKEHNIHVNISQKPVSGYALVGLGSYYYMCGASYSRCGDSRTGNDRSECDQRL